jgi:hypothetical protein
MNRFNMVIKSGRLTNIRYANLLLYLCLAFTERFKLKLIERKKERNERQWKLWKLNENDYSCLFYEPLNEYF